MRNYKNLKIWEQGIDLVKLIYVLAEQLPETEKFGLKSQITRAAISIPSNIAEGTSKSSNKHFNKYIEDSLGSSFEWETQLIVAFNQQYISDERFEFLEQKIQQLQKMISRFQDGLK